MSEEACGYMEEIEKGITQKNHKILFETIKEVGWFGEGKPKFFTKDISENTFRI